MNEGELETTSGARTKETKSGKSPEAVLVCFVGIDGAGKSTLAKGLVPILEEQGIRCRYLWGGFKSSFMVFRPFIAVMKGTLFRGNRFMGESDTKGRALKNPRLSGIYQYLALVDYIIQAFLRISLPLAVGTSVICDRYIYDLTASIGVLLDYPPDRILALLDRCLVLLPKPDLVFLLDLPEEVAYQRKDDIISLGSLSVRRETYLQMAQRHRMTVLDGSSDLGELAGLVQGKLFSYMAGE